MSMCSTWVLFFQLGTVWCLLLSPNLVLEISTTISNLYAKFRRFFPPGIAMNLRKFFHRILFPGKKSPGKFCPGEKIILEFSKNDFTKKWTVLEFPVLEFSTPGILFCPWTFHSGNHISRNLLASLRAAEMMLVIEVLWMSFEPFTLLIQLLLGFFSY